MLETMRDFLAEGDNSRRMAKRTHRYPLGYNDFDFFYKIEPLRGF
jgi:hypothetical protein